MTGALLAAARDPNPLSLLLVGALLGFIIGRVVFGRKATYAAGVAHGEASAAAAADARVNVINSVTATGQDGRRTDHHDDGPTAEQLHYVRTVLDHDRANDDYHVGSGSDLEYDAPFGSPDYEGRLDEYFGHVREHALDADADPRPGDGRVLDSRGRSPEGVKF